MAREDRLKGKAEHLRAAALTAVQQGDEAGARRILEVGCPCAHMPLPRAGPWPEAVS